MHPSLKKKKLGLTRETLKPLTRDQLVNVAGGYQLPQTWVSCFGSCKHSVCDSCYNSDCCLMPTDG
jgi:hypothetical protein